MKKIRLTESSLANKSYVMSVFNNLSESEKIKWLGAVKQCLNENPTLKRNIGAYTKLGGFTLIIVAVAIMISAPAALLLPALGVTFGVLDDYTWTELKKCVKAKIGGTTYLPPDSPVTSIERVSDETSSENLPESYKRKIRLTESELIQLIKKIIREN